MLVLPLSYWSCHCHAGPAMKMLVLPLACMSCYWHAGPSTGTHVLPFACWLSHWHARFSVPFLPNFFFLKNLSVIPSTASWRSTSSVVLLTSFLPLCHYSLYNFCISLLSQKFPFLSFIPSILVFSLYYVPLNVHNFMNQLNMSSLSRHLHNSIKLLHCCLIIMIYHLHHACLQYYTVYHVHKKRNTNKSPHTT
jgi:hypothetical protein